MNREPLQRPCKACKAPLLFVDNGFGGVVPLDMRVVAYEVKKDLAGTQVAVRADGVYVSHFVTCPKAEDFFKEKTT